MKTSNNKQRLKTYKIKNHDSGKTYSVKAVNYTDAKTKYNKHILKDNRHTFEALWYTDPDYDNQMTQTFTTEKEAMDFYRKNKGKPTFHGWWVTERYPGSWNIKRELVMDAITEDALSKFVQSYLGAKKVSSKAEQDEIIQFLLERNKITTEDIPKARSLLKIIKDAITEDALTRNEQAKLYHKLSKLNKSDLYYLAYGTVPRFPAGTPTEGLIKNAFYNLLDLSRIEINNKLKEVDLTLDSITEDAVIYGEWYENGFWYVNTNELQNTKRELKSAGYKYKSHYTNIDGTMYKYTVEYTKDSITEDAYVYPTNASTSMASSFAKQCVEKFGGKVAAKNGNKYVYVAPDKDTAEKAKTFLETKYNSTLPSVQFIVADSITEDADIAQTDIKSTYLPEDANADNIQYLGFNEKRKLSFYGYGDRYFVHYDLEGRTEEVDKETVQKILKKNILGEIDENDLINKEPQSEEIVTDAADIVRELNEMMDEYGYSRNQFQKFLKDVHLNKFTDKEFNMFGIKNRQEVIDYAKEVKAWKFDSFDWKKKQERGER